jgi:iron uptake system component EfeO
MRIRVAVALTGLAAMTALTACSPASSGAAAVGSGTPTSVALVATKSGCAPAPATLPAGPMTFTIRNDNARAVSEVELMKGSKVLGEKENLIPGKTASFSLRLAAGSYTVYCPGAKADKATFVVTAAS